MFSLCYIFPLDLLLLYLYVLKSHYWCNATSMAMSLILAVFCFCEQGVIRVFDVDRAASGASPLAEIPITREGEKVTITKVGWRVS